MLFGVLLTKSSRQWLLVTLTTAVSIGNSTATVLVGIKDRVNIRMDKEIGADDTLITSVIVGDYTLDHMFMEGRFHCDDYWTVGVDNHAMGHFDSTTYRELERLLVQSAFD
uniref:Uncharacterized protein n=1 Tax=Romanomermis culicivorax TaxID=13658 RepID=A0A915KJG3_ROMCU